MGFFDRLLGRSKANLATSETTTSADERHESMAGSTSNGIDGEGKKNRHLPYELKAIYRMRQDISDWNTALNVAQGLYPVNYPLQNLYDEIMIDALLTSQVENRINQGFTASWNLLNPDGTINEEQTAILRGHPIVRQLFQASYDKKLRGARVMELAMKQDVEGNNVLSACMIPFQNVVQQTGLFYPDYNDTSRFVKYREMAEFGTWILEYKCDDLGLLNKAVPHVLFKRFAQSCWSELCEIYGIPPRVMKTNTQDPVMLSRATKMMKDMGSAAWFIIDDNESFEWAQGMQTNGDVYSNLMDACRNEICLLLSGALIGQDTKNGNRSKDQSAQEMLWLLVQSDMEMITSDMQTIGLPALKKHGVIKGDLTFAFVPAEDTAALWKTTLGALQYYNIDPEWVKKKFGIEITGERQQATTPQQNEKKKLAALLTQKDKSFFA